MNKKLYVGSLPYSVGTNELEKMFGEIGTVVSVKIIIDKDTGQSKGFGFVEMSTEEEATNAISKLNGIPQGARKMLVSEAKSENKDGGKGGGRPGGGRSGGGGRPGGGGRMGGRGGPGGNRGRGGRSNNTPSDGGWNR